MIRVLQSVAAPGATVKYVDQVVRYAPADIEFEYFSWRAALFSRFDVLHVHWPEYFARGGSGAARVIKRVLAHILLWRIRRSAIPVVRTVHNLRPHAVGDRREAAVLARFDAATTIGVLLNPCADVDSFATVRIPHGDYREQFPVATFDESIRGRLVFAGRIEHYKGVTELITLALQSTRPDLHLRVVGNPTDEMRNAMTSKLESSSRRNRVSLNLGFVSDDSLVKELGEASLVVLPYKEMYNSGMMLLALSVGRPVLVPRGCVNDSIAEEVGPGWVYQYEGQLDLPQLESVLETVDQTPRATAPDFSGRDWSSIADSYANVYRRAVGVGR